MRPQLGMPLHAERERVAGRSTYRFDELNLVEGFCYEWLCEFVDALPVKRVVDDLVLADPILELTVELDLVFRPELDLIVLAGRLAVIVVPVDSVYRLMKRTAHRYVELLEAAADCEDRDLLFDGGPDERQRQSIAIAVDGARIDRRLFALIMYGFDVRNTSGQQDTVRHVEHRRDIGEARAERDEQWLAPGDLRNGGRILATNGIEHKAADVLAARR